MSGNIIRAQRRRYSDSDLTSASTSDLRPLSRPLISDLDLGFTGRLRRFRAQGLEVAVEFGERFVVVISGSYFGSRAFVHSLPLNNM